MLAADNKAIGTLQLTGIPSAPKGVPQIDVIFDIDANGILCIKAKNSKTGKIVETKIKDRESLINLIPGTICPYGRWLG